MTKHATGRSKNIFLTLWLIFPFIVVGTLVAGIFIAYRAGPAMDARPVGQGRADTGGANALGEWLAGNDANEQQRIARDLREGRLIDPIDWPQGVRLRLMDLAAGSTCLVIGWDGGHSTNFVIATDGDTELTHKQLQLVFATGEPKAGIYISTGSFHISRDSEPITENGRTIPVRFPLISSEDAVAGQPIEIKVSFE